jgi:hypothetical protein
MSGTSPADFVASLNAWCDGEDERMTRIVRGIAEKALARVKELTPVRTGFLRANWSIVPGGAELPAIVAVNGQENGSGATPLQIDLSAVKAGDVIRIVNPVSYARPVEYGWTVQAKGGDHRVDGRHMALQTVLELPTIAASVIADLSGGPARR